MKTRKTNGSISSEVTSAVRNSFQVLESMTDEDFRPQVETPRVLIFNSRIWGLFLARHHTSGKAPDSDELSEKSRDFFMSGSVSTMAI
jgi:hypothetical protein